MVVGVKDRPTYIRSLLPRLRDSENKLTYVSADPEADIQIPLSTGSDIEFLIKFTIYVVLSRFPDDVDVVHARRIVTLFPYTIYSTNAKLVATCPGPLTEEMAMNHSKWFVRLYNIIERLSLFKTDIIIAQSESSKYYLISKYSTIEDKITVIPFGADSDKFYPRDKKRMRQKHGIPIGQNVILYAGRFSDVKNISLLINAFSEVRQGDDWQLLLAGEGETEHEIRDLIQSKDLDPFVSFLGYLPQNELGEVMSLSDCFVLTSISEGGPKVIREAISCGLPVVSTDVGEANEIITNGENGYVVEEFESKAIASRIQDVINSQETFRQDCINMSTGFDSNYREIVNIYTDLTDSMCVS